MVNAPLCAAGGACSPLSSCVVFDDGFVEFRVSRQDGTAEIDAVDPADGQLLRAGHIQLQTSAVLPIAAGGV